MLRLLFAFVLAALCFGLRTAGAQPVDYRSLTIPSLRQRAYGQGEFKVQWGRHPRCLSIRLPATACAGAIMR
jgi:hypothetical protein